MTSCTTAAAAPARAEYHLDARKGGPFGIEWTLNGVAFRHGEHAAHAGAQGTVLPSGELSRIRFVNDSFLLHPMHMHGMFFRLLSRNGRPAGEAHFRDTVLLHPKETVDLATVPLDR